MDGHPPPPPPPRRTSQSSQAHLAVPVVSPQSQTRSLSPNVLSSQEFKDELRLKQSRLSPVEDSPISIDEKIRLRKHQPGGTINDGLSPSHHNNHPHHQQQMPDQLLSSSATLQRDKRPFAYSPDVSDPKNRGKLDLSHIKSPTMRRRLQANMESSSSGDDDDKEETVEQRSKNHVDLNNEIASSLQSLSLLANNLDESVRQCNRSLGGDQKQLQHQHQQHYHHHHHHHHHQQQQQQQQQQLQCSHYNTSYRAPDPQQGQLQARSQQQQQPVSPSVSTFSPTRTPSFYSVLPSGRQVRPYPSCEVATSIPQTIRVDPARGPLLELPSQAAPQYASTSSGIHDDGLSTYASTLRPAAVNRYTSEVALVGANNLDYHSHDQRYHYNYQHNQPSAADPYGTGPRLGRRHDGHDVMSVSSSEQHHSPSGIFPPFGNRQRGDLSNRERVEALREMTAQLEREVNRLHSLRLPGERLA